MTESEWLSCDDPQAMLRLATGFRSRCCGCLWCDNGDGTISLANGQQPCPACDNRRPAAERLTSDRKLRLFACACMRTAPIQWTISAADRATVAAAEEWADSACPPDDSPRYHHSGVAWCLYPDAIQAATAWTRSRGQPGCARNVAMAALLREIVGNPFRPTVFDRLALRPDCWRDGWPDLAQRIYADRDWLLLPLLADALLDAGCEDESVLAHLHTHGPHVRGCWAVDLVLGKE